MAGHAAACGDRLEFGGDGIQNPGKDNRSELLWGKLRTIPGTLECCIFWANQAEARVPFLKSLRLQGILSFPPDSEAIELRPLNVLIGPNGSGKSNLIEAIELLHATPTGFASAIRDGGGVREWLWKGDDSRGQGSIEALVRHFDVGQSLASLYEGHIDLDGNAIRYRLSFSSIGQRVEITEEVLEDLKGSGKRAKNGHFYYRFQAGAHIVNARAVGALSKVVHREQREIDRKILKPDESILLQIKDPSVYPELTELGRKFEDIRSFREWTIGPDAEVRKPQPADLPADVLAPDSRNLGLILNQLEHSGTWSEFNGYLSRFLPRFQRYTTRIEGGTVQFYLHENGLKQPIPATRLSDGTIRFMAILAQLLSPTPPPLICIEEPELGLHPDAIALLASLFQEASARTQLIVTTHSDALVSALTDHADSVLVCEYRNGTVLQRVDSSKMKFWLDKYRLGEIWRMGEIGGNL
ncbi:MAG: AAA family ATPase [Terracidiphilus sp.]